MKQSWAHGAQPKGNRVPATVYGTCWYRRTCMHSLPSLRNNAILNNYGTTVACTSPHIGPLLSVGARAVMMLREQRCNTAQHRAGTRPHSCGYPSRASTALCCSSLIFWNLQQQAQAVRQAGNKSVIFRNQLQTNHTGKL
jgi:hypothetical protein